MFVRNKISSFSIILMFVCLSFLGLALIPLLPVKISPSQTLPNISIYFSMHGSSPRMVEVETTSKLEAMLNRMQGIQRITSTSGNGKGQINLEFNKHTNMEIARFEVSTIIRQTWPSLPTNVSYPTISQNFADQQANRAFMTFSINAPTIPQEIQHYTEKNISPYLALINGIDKVEVSGATPMIWKLEYDAHSMQQYNVEIKDIQAALANTLEVKFLNMTYGQSADNKTEWVRVVLQPTQIKETNPFAGIGVKNLDGTLIPLEKLTKISRTESEPYFYFRINGLNSIYLSITASANSNQLELQKIVKQKIEKLTTQLPQGYEIHTSYDATEYIKTELNKVYFRSGLTLIILLLFILLSYRNLKYTLLIVLSLSCNLAISVIAYYFLRLELQLYSLMGITISLTLILDNMIVMADHILHTNNKKSFMAILAATITTIASLSVIFFLEEKIRLSLLDFAAVISVNLTVSLLVALFLVPALIDKFRLTRRPKQSGQRRSLKRFTQKRKLYSWYVAPLRRIFDFIYRWKSAVVISLILAFGLPVFLLPDKLEDSSRLAGYYNTTLGSAYYKEHIAPVVNNVLGGTLRLFVQKVYNGSYFARQEETTLQVNASLPSHSSLQEMNKLIQEMESYLSQFNEIKQFQTQIYNARRATITIQFTAKHAKSAFPHILKSNLVSKSLQMGGGSWSVYGLGDAFSNDVRESAGSYRVEMFGFNYDELYLNIRRFEKKLLENRRIKEVNITPEFSWFKDEYEEFLFLLNKEKLAEEDIQPYELFHRLNFILGRDFQAGNLKTVNGNERILLRSKQANTYDIWNILHSPIHIGKKKFKLAELAKIEKVSMPQEIVKVNQQYRLCLQYEYIGAAEQGKKVLTRAIDDFGNVLPAGYTIKDAETHFGWDNTNYRQYVLLLMIFINIYFISAILFNSLRQPLCILFVIPISFIGIFLTFYLFRINFDQGGFASFILLSGLTINANIYIINAYNNIKKAWPKMPALRAYNQAWNAKVRPIILTVLSTVLGFLPFLIGDNKEGFWFPLAVGTIGGLIVSTCATFLFLPLFLGVLKKPSSHSQNNSTKSQG